MTRIAIVGGGIGGLTAAIALRSAGFSAIEVFERAPDIREVGAALTLWSNAMRVLARFGLDGDVRAAGREVLTGQVREPSGAVIVETPVADVARELGFPCVCIHRADLQAILVRALRGVPLRLGMECASVTAIDSPTPRLLFASGREVESDVVVGADGLRSVVRAALLGALPPRYAGYPCWRAITRFEAASLPPGLAFETWGPGARFGAIGIGAERVYWFASANAPAGGRDGADPKRELLDRFGAWHEPIAAVIESTAAEAIQRLDIFDRPPAREVGRGRVTLMGDAAHPTTPNLGQGACLAIEDALALALSLRLVSPPERALREYEARRRARTAAVVRRSRRLGAMGQLSSPLLCRLRNAAMRLAPERWMRRAFAVNLTEGMKP
jgi:2-polyprenyl-6-methoxyphenol hydroxylase-like FAD-dependent oxidoreductase